MVNFNCSAQIIGADSQTVKIITDPAGIPVDGQPNTYDYPILTNVTLMCMVTPVNGPLTTVISYRWKAMDCYVKSRRKGDLCFYANGMTGQNITGIDLSAKDKGTVTCTATIDDIEYTSDSLTLRISGELFIIVLL